MIGPQKAVTNVRAICRFDFQMDVCKDYKETGYCGFGDSCKFLHDRSDSKNSWLLEKEWTQSQIVGGAPTKTSKEFELWKHGIAGAKRKPEASSIACKDLSLVCPICNKLLNSPCETPCKHYFCTSCMLSRLGKGKFKCFVCGTNTNGVINRSEAMQNAVAKQRELQSSQKSLIEQQMMESGMVQED